MTLWPISQCVLIGVASSLLASTSVLAQIAGDCKIPEAVLIASDPPEGGTLCKTNKNVIRLTFDSPLPYEPAAGDILIQEVLSDGSLGFDLANAFLFTVEPDNKLKIKDSGFTLLNLRWYAISNSAPCDGIEDFRVDLFTLPGDVNGDGRVQNRDMAVINNQIPTTRAADDNRADVNSSSNINFSDPPIVNQWAPKERTPMDCLPSPPVPRTVNVEFEPECVRASIPTELQFELTIAPQSQAFSSVDLYVGTNGPVQFNSFAYATTFAQVTSYRQDAVADVLPCVYDQSMFFGGFIHNSWDPQDGSLLVGRVYVDLNGWPYGIYEISVDGNLDGSRSVISDHLGKNARPLFGKARIFLGQAPIFLFDSTEPQHDAVLHKSRRNSVTFEVIPDGLTAAHGHFSVRELLPDGQFGPELIENFTVQYGPEGRVTLSDNGATLLTQKWYAFGNNDSCDDIQDQVVHLQVLIGDANSDGNVNFADMAFVNVRVPAVSVDPSNGRDINKDGNINFADLAAINAHAPASIVPKPSGH